MIFVFGSNLAGRHGKGAALHALKNCGAVYGVGIGRQGDSYGIPTKDKQLRVLSKQTIFEYVQVFCEYARQHKHLTFQVTNIGCGLAGYLPEDIAPMFRHAPENCVFSKQFKRIITQRNTE